MKTKCPECKVWREVVAMLIDELPRPKRDLVCAQLATIPCIAEKLTPAERGQAALIRKVNASRRIHLNKRLK